MTLQYDEIKLRVSSLINPKRFEHSMGVEKEAVKLCHKYGCNIDNARIAAIAHDCAKDYSDTELLKMADKYCIEADIIQKASPQLLHGPVGASYCRDKFNIYDDEILSSICYHTTGKKDMTLFEKIIYIADFIEEGRQFPGVDAIREEAYRDLDAALLMSCDSTLRYIMENKLPIHPLTIEFRNSLILKGGLTSEEE
jgi:predicted HD superfamily hydrolase involved in NAD metabolism